MQINGRRHTSKQVDVIYLQELQKKLGMGSLNLGSPSSRAVDSNEKTSVTELLTNGCCGGNTGELSQQLTHTHLSASIFIDTPFVFQVSFVANKHNGWIIRTGLKNKEDTKQNNTHIKFVLFKVFFHVTVRLPSTPMIHRTSKFVARNCTHIHPLTLVGVEAVLLTCYPLV